MNDRFTQRVRKVLFLARDEAGRLQHDYIGTEHLLLGIVREGEVVAANVLRHLNIDFDRIQKAVEDSVTAPNGPVSIGEIPFTPRAKKVLELSIDEARLHNHSYVGTEHLLLALIREGEGVAARVLSELGADHEQVKREVMKNLGGGEAPKQQPAGRRKRKEKKENSVLEQFGRNMTDMAREGKLDPTIGRSKEIDRCIQILSRRKKNNPVLIGEPGVGKTAIVEGFASKIVEGNVPALLREKEIVTLDLASVVAGTKYRGQFEERLKQIMAEIRENPDVILFIDELHTIVGAGGAEGAIDASNMLKPALSRGEIQCVGATTMDEYRKFIEKDGALERRFQMVTVNPPSEEETVEILFGLRDKYEAHHRVKFDDDAIKAATFLSNRYISSRSLPDKAIDILDEAGSRARLSMTIVPPDLRELEQRITETVTEKESAIQSQEFEKAASFRDEEKELKKQLQDLKRNWNSEQSDPTTTVSEALICQVIADITGIPVSEVEEEETDKLLRMEEELGKWVIGQEVALEAVSKAIRRNRAGLRDPQAPHRVVHLPGSQRRGQDRGGPPFDGIPLRGPEQPDPGGHVRVHGEAQRQSPGGRASGLCGLRRGRHADREGPSQALQRDPAGRDREGSPRCVQHPAAGAGRRPADRQLRPHRGLPQQRADHDQQRGQPQDPRRARRRLRQRR